jgi:hypothetical protein
MVMDPNKSEKGWMMALPAVSKAVTVIEILPGPNPGIWIAVSVAVVPARRVPKGSVPASVLLKMV